MFEFFSLKETLTASMILFAVIDIIGSVPIIVGLKKKFGKIEAERASIVAGALMIAFLFIGNNIFDIFLQEYLIFMIKFIFCLNL